MREVDRHFYATVVREMIYHENDLTNHCIMWLLISPPRIEKLCQERFPNAVLAREGMEISIGRQSEAANRRPNPTSRMDSAEWRMHHL
jgi:hypothetical protein